MSGPEEANPTRIPFEQWRNGDDAAFAVLHARFTPLLRARVRRHRVWPFLAAHFDLDDVLQEIWARAATAARTTFRNLGPGSLFAFLGKIADREVIDLARRHRAKKRGDGGAAELSTGFDAAGAARPGCSTPETPTSRARVVELSALARQELNPREFEAWEMVEMRDYTPEEAGLAMRCSGSAVRGLLMRARARLVARLAHDRRTVPANDPDAGCDSAT